ncbi:MAG: aminomethyl transferase family protein, partial [Planctomycetes bacterium]|nr:aminomethyl transferase family protein [Planctomycetota bacterium]
MPIESPFHPRTSRLCTSLRYKDWSGYHAVCRYDTYHEREYFAFRHAAGLIDVTPLFKYNVHGPDTAAFLSHIMVKNIAKLKLGQVTYCCWCDDRGKLLDDGTVWRLEDTYFRVTAAEPSLAWFEKNKRGYDVTIEDVTDRLGALSLQGPTSREILKNASDANLDELKFFRLTPATIDGFDVIITRTGYTGDLGYEIWVENENACKLHDALMDAGKHHGIEPAGLDAMDITRVEAGFIMNGIDYYSANHCLIDKRMSTPYEASLGWTVNLKRDPFIGQEALKLEKQQGPKREFVGLVLDWDEYETLQAAQGLPPEICSEAWRESRPVYA